jgi:Arc/MetJ-type ribon-helix-helix transcriptional regulator
MAMAEFLTKPEAAQLFRSRCEHVRKKLEALRQRLTEQARPKEAGEIKAIFDELADVFESRVEQEIEEAGWARPGRT